MAECFVEIIKQWRKRGWEMRDYLYNKAGEDNLTYELDHDLELNASREILMEDNEENDSIKIVVGTNGLNGQIFTSNEIDNEVLFDRNVIIDLSRIGSLETNTKYEIDGDLYETDDNGDIYKKNIGLMSNTVYEKKGITYITDDKSRISIWNGEPGYEPENERDGGAQIESGGEDRENGDDGGHLVARILGGSSGIENIVPMRDTVNRGDYKKSENEIAEAKKQGKDVQDSGKVLYEGDSLRPSKIERTYTVDGEKRELKVDNVEGSQDLLENVEGDISEEDLDNLKDEIADMEEDGCEVSVTSVFKKYDKDENLVSVRVCVTNETIGEKSYKMYKVGKDS